QSLKLCIEGCRASSIGRVQAGRECAGGIVRECLGGGSLTGSRRRRRSSEGNCRCRSRNRTYFRRIQCSFCINEEGSGIVGFCRSGEVATERVERVEPEKLVLDERPAGSKSILITVVFRAIWGGRVGVGRRVE